MYIIAMAMKSKADAITPNQVLKDWIESCSISMAQCTRDLGYQSNYIFLLLSPTNPRPITYEVLGRLFYTYGDAGPARAVADAMRADRERERATGERGNGRKVR